MGPCSTGSFYCDITALKNTLATKWPDPAESRAFAYLRAELTRQAGRDAEALRLFHAVISFGKNTRRPTGRKPNPHSTPQPLGCALPIR